MVYPPCPRCGHEHARITFTRWAWQLRDMLDKPPAAQMAVLFTLGTIMDPKTGCGFASIKHIAQRANAGEATAKRALTMAQRRGILLRTVRGHHIKDDDKTVSSYRLLELPQQVTADPLASDRTDHSDPLAWAPNRSIRPTQQINEGDPTDHHEPLSKTSKDRPVKTDPTPAAADAAEPRSPKKEEQEPARKCPQCGGDLKHDPWAEPSVTCPSCGWSKGSGSSIGAGPAQSPNGTVECEHCHRRGGGALGAIVHAHDCWTGMAWRLYEAER